MPNGRIPPPPLLLIPCVQFPRPEFIMHYMMSMYEFKQHTGWFCRLNTQLAVNCYQRISRERFTTCESIVSKVSIVMIHCIDSIWFDRFDKVRKSLENYKNTNNS